MTRGMRITLLITGHSDTRLDFCGYTSLRKCSMHWGMRRRGLPSATDHPHSHPQAHTRKYTSVEKMCVTIAMWEIVKVRETVPWIYFGIGQEII